MLNIITSRYIATSAGEGPGAVALHPSPQQDGRLHLGAGLLHFPLHQQDHRRPDRPRHLPDHQVLPLAGHSVLNRLSGKVYQLDAGLFNTRKTTSMR